MVIRGKGSELDPDAGTTLEKNLEIHFGVK
jgi:hypothetical protein